MTLRDWIYFLLLVSNAVLAGVRWRDFSSTDRFLGTLMWITLIDELIAYTLDRNHISNAAVYNIYSPCEFILLSLYFNGAISAFKRHGVGWILGGAAIIGSIAYYLFW